MITASRLYLKALIHLRFPSRFTKHTKNILQNSNTQLKFSTSASHEESINFKDYIEFSSPQKYSVIPKGFQMFPNIIPSHEQDFIVNEVEAEIANNRYAKWNEFHRR